jgi:hypothetical protein
VLRHIVIRRLPDKKIHINTKSSEKHKNGVRILSVKRKDSRGDIVMSPSKSENGN